ncbi:hypothetical protein ACFV27_34225 [Streptomyces antimycoticus]|uniref:hypothetical protein n=1 Tax=Streptomyces antimycoticus TaxID=68175 RepID=UPI002570B94B|nr:hypothetical protein [Streptomyces antimycoticus]WJE00680.1 hypothetical protein QR300_34510 [Streptomyces antimycoticus]
MFLATFTKDSTRNQRRTYLQEYLSFLAAVRQCAEQQLTTGDLLDRVNVDDWLAAARRGATRRRAGAQGRYTKPAVNSMAARTSTINTFARFCGMPLDLPRPQPDEINRITAVEAHRTLRLLARHRPARILAATWERSVAVIALAVCSRRGFPDLHMMRLHDVQLDRALPRARVVGEWYPLDTFSRHVLIRWLTTHQRLTAGNHGAFEEVALWVTTSPGRRRAGDPPPAAGSPAKLRTLESAHRQLTTQTLGAPLLLEQFCGAEGEDRYPPPAVARRISGPDFPWMTGVMGGPPRWTGPT